MSVFVSQKHIIDSAMVIFKKMYHLFDDGKAGSADVEYQLLLNNLWNILGTGEAQEEAVMIVETLIKGATSFMNLGIFVGGTFKSISPAQAARNGLKSGSYISGARFLVLTQDEAHSLINDVNATPPDGVMWDERTSSLVSEGYYYRSHPELISNLETNEIERLNLEEALNDYRLNST